MEGLDDIIQEFLVESHENLDQLDRDLVSLEEQPQSRELVSRIFRTIHTIKGTSGFLAFTNLESVTHAGESLLSRLRDGTQPVTADTISTLLAMVDSVRSLLASIEESGGEGEIGIDAFQADRSPTHQYRTTPLRGLFAREKGGFYHDGRFPTYRAVIDHYDGHLRLGLTESEKVELENYLRSL